MTGDPTNPGCVVPSIVTGLVIGGSADAGVIVNGAAPGMLKTILSAPGLALASMIARRSDPDPAAALSVLLVTMKTAEGELVTIAGLVWVDLRITKSPSASPFNRIGNAATGSPSISRNVSDSP